MSNSTTRTIDHSAADLALNLHDSLSALLARTRQLLRKEAAPEDARDLRQIERQALTCRAALRSAVAEENQAAPKSMVLRADEILTRALEWAEPRARAAGVRIGMALHPDLPRILGDPVTLEHAFLLVLVDALRDEEMGCAGMYITAETTSQAGRPAVRIVISDERLTPDFIPIPDLWTPGQSRGLAVARDVVVDHGGTFDIQGEPGGGLSVEIILPALTNTWSDD